MGGVHEKTVKMLRSHRRWSAAGRPQCKIMEPPPNLDLVMVIKCGGLMGRWAAGVTRPEVPVPVATSMLQYQNYTWKCFFRV